MAAPTQGQIRYLERVRAARAASIKQKQKNSSETAKEYEARIRQETIQRNTPPSQEQNYTPLPEATPIASAQEGGVVFSDGFRGTPVATSISGGTIFQQNAAQERRNEIINNGRIRDKPNNLFSRNSDDNQMDNKKTIPEEFEEREKRSQANIEQNTPFKKEGNVIQRLGYSAVSIFPSTLNLARGGVDASVYLLKESSKSKERRKEVLFETSRQVVPAIIGTPLVAAESFSVLTREGRFNPEGTINVALLGSGFSGRKLVETKPRVEIKPETKKLKLEIKMPEFLKSEAPVNERIELKAEFNTRVNEAPRTYIQPRSQRLPAELRERLPESQKRVIRSKLEYDTLTAKDTIVKRTASTPEEALALREQSRLEARKVFRDPRFGRDFNTAILEDSSYATKAQKIIARKQERGILDATGTRLLIGKERAQFLETVRTNKATARRMERNRLAYEKQAKERKRIIKKDNVVNEKDYSFFDKNDKGFKRKRIIDLRKDVSVFGNKKGSAQLYPQELIQEFVQRTKPKTESRLKYPSRSVFRAQPVVLAGLSKNVFQTGTFANTSGGSSAFVYRTQTEQATEQITRPKQQTRESPLSRQGFSSKSKQSTREALASAVAVASLSKIAQLTTSKTKDEFKKYPRSGEGGGGGGYTRNPNTNNNFSKKYSPSLVGIETGLKANKFLKRQAGTKGRGITGLEVRGV